MKITKLGLGQISVLTTILLLNSGCAFGLFGGEPEIQKRLNTKQSSRQQPTTSVQKLVSMPIPQECTDDINNPCNKGLISAKELKPKKLITQTGGEVHRLRSIQGEKITIVERSNGYIFPEFKNKVVILEMFGKSCSHCIKEMPIMSKLHQQYRNNLEIIALQVEGKMSPMQANALLRRHKITYPVISGDTATNLQYHVQNTYGWTGILPFIMVIKNGVTEFSYRGSITYDEINNDIRSLLQ